MGLNIDVLRVFARLHGYEVSGWLCSKVWVATPRLSVSAGGGGGILFGSEHDALKAIHKHVIDTLGKPK